MLGQTIERERGRESKTKTKEKLCVIQTAFCDKKKVQIKEVSGKTSHSGHLTHTHTHRHMCNFRHTSSQYHTVLIKTYRHIAHTMAETHTASRSEHRCTHVPMSAQH